MIPADGATKMLLLINSPLIYRAMACDGNAATNRRSAHRADRQASGYGYALVLGAEIGRVRPMRTRRGVLACDGQRGSQHRYGQESTRGA